jgi:hypothetical protein
MSDDEIRRLFRIAEALARSGMFKDVKSAEQAFSKMILGRDLGLTPAQSMQGLYLVDGSIMVAYPMLGQFIRSRPGYDYKVIEHDTDHCRIEFTRDGESQGISEYTMANARDANLANKHPWKASPRNMLFARAMSNGVKWFIPEVLGGLPVYVEGEIPARAELTEGDGDGSAQGIDLGPRVDAVIERATLIGHQSYADRATIEILLGGRSPQVVTDWVAKAKADLDEFESNRVEVADAEVVESDVPIDAEGLPEPGADSETEGQLL